MHGYLTRVAKEKLNNSLKRSPAVAILGPRQCGKSTMAKCILQGQDAIYLVLERGGKSHFFEFKLSKAPKPSRGFYQLVDDMKPDSAWVVAPVDDYYDIRHDIHVCPLNKLPPL